MNDKAFALELIKLLSAIESWGFGTKERIPDYLHERLAYVVERLTEEVLE